MPSADDMEKVYPVEDWSRDMDFWFSKGTLSPAATRNVAACDRSRPVSGTGVRSQSESGPAVTAMPSPVLTVQGTIDP